jgi:phosphoribosylformimino-5-aminoimidazole carboxamide ribotide isomerase
MQIVPVIDLLGGQVVRGIGGRRSEYRPIESQLASGSDPGAIASAFVEHFGATTCYVADLDAIERGQWSVDSVGWQAVSSAGLRLWLDSGATSTVPVLRAWQNCRLSGINADYIVGLESLAMDLDLLCRSVEPFHVPLIFSLDMKDGHPLVRYPPWKSLNAKEITDRVMEAGITRLIVLDLADVGASGGTRTLDLCWDLHAKYPQLELIAGGGVRNLADLKRIADAGCRGALVASALHDGGLTKADWSAALEY